MFSSSLRRRPLWKSLGPSLSGTPGLTLKESNLGTHEFEFPLTTPQNGTRRLRIALVMPDDVESGQNREKTVQRLEQLNVVSGGCDVAVILISSEEDITEGQTGARGNRLQPLLRLQRICLESLSSPIPILLASTPSALPPILRDHLTTTALQTTRTATATTTQLPPTALLSHAAESADGQTPAYLPTHTANILTDLFPSLRSLCLAARSEEGQLVLREYFDEETVRAIVAFWGGRVLVG